MALFNVLLILEQRYESYYRCCFIFSFSICRSHEKEKGFNSFSPLISRELLLSYKLAIKFITHIKLVPRVNARVQRGEYLYGRNQRGREKYEA